MTNKETLIDLLEKGFCVEIVGKMGDTFNFYPIKNSKGYLSGCDEGIYDFDDSFIDDSITITKIYRQPIKPFKVGDKVRISEEIKKLAGRNDKYVSFNTDYKIETAYDDDVEGLRYKLKNSYIVISHEFLIPVLDERKQVGDECGIEIEGELRKIKIIE